MSEMVERVARAMLKSELGKQAIWRHLSEEGREGYRWSKPYWRSQARAAIEEMREPTQQMRLAGIAEWSRPDPTSEHESTLVFNAIWRAMIDEALK